MKRRESSLDCDDELEWGRDRLIRYGNDGEMVMYIESKLSDGVLCKCASKLYVNTRDSVELGAPIPIPVGTLGRDESERMRAGVVVE